MIISESRDVINALSSIRVERSLRQSDIDGIMGTSKSSISRLEKHVHSPTLRMLFRYADVLSVELEFRVKR